MRLEGPVAVIVAHPDDETIGAGGQLAHLPDVMVIHVTDGAPRREPDSQSCVATRRRELEAAMALVGLGPERLLSLGVADQEASLDLAGLAVRLAALLAALKPATVLTHPYEGGHPDHDATAFAVHAAARLLPRSPVLMEMAFYHAGGGDMVWGDFLGPPGAAIPTEQALKRRMLACFATQARTLAPFPVDMERFRPAPIYDFTQPPHAGPLHYERYPWGMDGARWRALATAALTTLGLPSCP